ncbi:MAG: exopolysaccharide biosynthesis polyprenyl glycosylphosphotransferase [Cryomorphaceae bacterium]|nr:MAG: exopolysaccharide biosynthesis polyprenyl glycosylphosphotransferase [Cryomorphaceae bacterium]
MNRDYVYFLRLYTRLANYVALNVAFALGLWFRFPDNWAQVFGSNNYIALLLYVNLSWVLITNVLRYYRPSRMHLKPLRRGLLFAQIFLLHLLLVLAFNGIIKTYYSRLFLTYFYLLIPLLILTGEWMAKLLLNWNQRRNGDFGKLVFAGSTDTLKDLNQYFENSTGAKYQGRTVHVEQTTNLLNTLMTIHKQSSIQELYCSMSEIEPQELQKVAQFCENNLIRVRLVVDHPRWDTKPIEVNFYDSIPVVNIPFTPLDEPGNKLAKRAFDVLFSLFVVVFVLSWLFPLMGILIKLSSPGPVIFRQRRNGLDNQPFECLKFRSMRVNATADLEQATQNDPRITAIGRFIRATSLDELPQFINVLKGEMSVVGPRPHMLKHTEQYAQLVGQFMQRHAIKPGVTGLAQVKGFRGEINQYDDIANRVKYDRFYVENWSLALDIKIVLLTVVTVFRRQ